MRRWMQAHSSDRGTLLMQTGWEATHTHTHTNESLLNGNERPYPFVCTYFKPFFSITVLFYPRLFSKTMFVH